MLTSSVSGKDLLPSKFIDSILLAGPSQDRKGQPVP